MTTHKKKILQVLPYSYHLHSWGVEKIAQTISDGLNSWWMIVVKNLASDVVRGETKDLSQFSDTLFTPSFDLVYNFPFPKFWSKVFWKQIQEIKYWHPDVILTHTRFFLQSMFGGLLAKYLWCKRLHIEHGSGFVVGYPWYIRCCARLFDRTIGLWILRQCDQIVTISSMHKQFVNKFTKKDPLIIYNPVDYTPKQRLDNIKTHIGFIGRLVPLKGVDILIDALKKLEDRDWICTIVGDGTQRKLLEEQVYTLWLEQRIHFVWADDRANRLYMFDVLVNPSHQEWVPTTVVEALMQQCIVVATDVGGTREISDKKDLILVESWSVEALQSWIEHAFYSLGKSGQSYEWVMKKFGAEWAITKYRKVIESSII